MIKILKLVTGEEIIADVVEGDDFYTLKSPCAIQLYPNKSDPSTPLMGLIPYAAYTEYHRVDVKTTFVVWIDEPMKELYNQYNQNFGSGLVVPTL